MTDQLKKQPDGADHDIADGADAIARASAAKPTSGRRGPGRPFVKGRSGNRKGRPPRPSPEIDFRKVLLTELTQMVKLPGVKGKVPAIQAVVRGSINSAVKGNSRSQHEVLQLYRDICREQEVLRDVINAYAREARVSAEEIVSRLRQMGIEVPGNFEVLQNIVNDLAREEIRMRAAAAQETAAHWRDQGAKAAAPKSDAAG